jgi:hypothetical protein
MFISGATANACTNKLVLRAIEICGSAKQFCEITGANSHVVSNVKNAKRVAPGRLLVAAISVVGAESVDIINAELQARREKGYGSVMEYLQWSEKQKEMRFVRFGPVKKRAKKVTV